MTGGDLEEVRSIDRNHDRWLGRGDRRGPANAVEERDLAKAITVLGGHPQLGPRSANRTVSSRRSWLTPEAIAADGSVADGCGATGATGATAVPQLGQNRAPGGSVAAHSRQGTGGV